jgi:hypothetical protein
MAALGFERDGEIGRFKNDKYRVWDVVPRNVLVDKDGDMYVIDAEIAMNKNTATWRHGDKKESTCPYD